MKLGLPCSLPLARDLYAIARRFSLACGFAGAILIAPPTHAQTSPQAPNAQIPRFKMAYSVMPGDSSFVSAAADSGWQQQSKHAIRQSDDATICGITHIGRCIKDLAEDDKGIFTSPMRLRPKDASWLLPLGGATGLALAYDTDAETAEGYDKGRQDTANMISNFGSFYASGGEGAAIYFIGLGRHNAKLAETGRLGAEAVIDSGTIVLATKLATNRERPLEGDHRGSFWTNGTGSWHWDSSFPSDHAAASMSLARVIAGEYPRWYVAVPAYGFAETISVSRILANAHFPSDVVIGQAIGFLTGSYILHKRSQYCCGRTQSVADRVISSLDPITDPRTRTVGASFQIPLGR